MKHTKQRFIDRIWKTIYRKILRCLCYMCQNPEVFVLDEYSASHLFDCQNEMNIEYRDTL